MWSFIFSDYSEVAEVKGNNLIEESKKWMDDKAWNIKKIWEKCNKLDIKKDRENKTEKHWQL